MQRIQIPILISFINESLPIYLGQYSEKKKITGVNKYKDREYNPRSKIIKASYRMVKNGKRENLAIDDQPTVLGGVVLRDLSQSEELSINTHLLFLVSPLCT